MAHKRTTPAFSRVPKQGDKIKVAHKWGEVLCRPYVLGGPKTRGQNQRWPTKGQNCHVTAVLSGVPKRGAKVKGGPQKGGSATLPPPCKLPGWRATVSQVGGGDGRQVTVSRGGGGLQWYFKAKCGTLHGCKKREHV